jgi:hypothetical protein
MSVAITVHVFVFYNLAIAMGGMSNRVFVASRGIVGKEFACAFLLEIFVASPLSMRIAFRAVNPREEKPYVVTTAIICATVGLMCPMMSLIATILYDGINVEFFAHWMQKMFINFPLAFFSQLFFIQPFVRFLFGAIFGKQTEKARASA